MEELYKDLEKLTKKELRALVDKGSLSGSEVETAKKAVCLLKMLEDDYDKDLMMDDSDYSEASYATRHMGGRMSSHSMRPMHWDDMSYARGRDGATGRFVSRGRMYDDRSYEGNRMRDGRSYNQGRSYERGRSYGYEDGDEYMSGRRMIISYDNGYSGHSIDDRIVDALEQMMDQAVTDYERGKLNEVIRFVDSRRGQ